MIRALWRLLRSRKLAAALIVGLTVYAGITTLVPLGSPRSPTVASWLAAHPFVGRITLLVGLHQAYTSPLFLAAAGLLVLSTAACAWERTASAVGEFRGRGVVTPSMLARLKERPHASILLPDGVGGAEAIAIARESLERSGLRTRSGPRVVEGHGHTLGLVGSPLFHWALVALFVFSGVGQLTRAAGSMDVVEGTSKPDVHASYAALSEGALFGERHTGLRIAVRSVISTLVVDGVERGATPVVRVDDGSTVLADQPVYPNHPLVQGPLMIHRDDLGLGVLMTFEATEGAGPQLLAFALGKAEGSAPPPPYTVALTAPSRAVYTVRLEVRPQHHLAIATRPAGSEGNWTERVVTQGQWVGLPEGMRARVDRLTIYARLTVVNDWSIPYIYTVLGLVTLSVCIAVFLPPRSARAMLVLDDDGGARLNVVTRQRRSDPAFRGSVLRRMQAIASDADAASKEDQC